MKSVPLSNGEFALVDDADYSRVTQYPWHVNHDGRVVGNVGDKVIFLNRFLMNPRDDEEVDHKNRDKLDHQRCNLRICDSSQNKMNRPGKGRVSKYKGVTLYRPKNLWRARISAYGKHFFIGYFKDEVEAARAYDRWARELHGEFAYLNFPEDQPCL